MLRLLALSCGICHQLPCEVAFLSLCPGQEWRTSLISASLQAWRVPSLHGLC